MQIERSATSLSWIPSDSIPGLLKVPFSEGLMHYDPPPPLTIIDVEGMRRRGEFRFANILRAWIGVEDGTIRECGYSGAGLMGLTAVTVGSLNVLLPTKANQEIRREPEVTADAVRFVQTAGQNALREVERSDHNHGMAGNRAGARGRTAWAAGRRAGRPGQGERQARGIHQGTRLPVHMRTSARCRPT
jgi:hypothetical protein